MNPGEVTWVIMKFQLAAHIDQCRIPSSHTSQPQDRRPRVRLALPHPGARRARHDAAPGGHPKRGLSHGGH